MSEVGNPKKSMRRQQPIYVGKHLILLASKKTKHTLYGLNVVLPPSFIFHARVHMNP